MILHPSRARPDSGGMNDFLGRIDQTATGPSPDDLPIVVIGAGPVGLAAAAHLVARGHRPIVLEAGPRVGASVRAWGHVRMFSPWKYDIDPAARRLLDAHGWIAPEDEAHPTGNDLVEQYLEPLARVPEIASGLRLGTEVIGISRRRTDKLGSTRRDAQPFTLRLRTPGGEARLLARSVIDASGTWRTPNPVGADGMPALGEDDLRAHVSYGIPDVLQRDRARFEGRRVLVVGSGHSAFNAVLDLVQLRERAPATRIVWAFRRGDLVGMTGGGGRDELPARGELGARVQALLDGGSIEVVTGFAVDAISGDCDGIVAHSGRSRIGPVDEIVAATGFRPNLEVFRELRVEMDALVESPSVLAPMIDPNLHSCGTVPPHGALELSHPQEQRFFVVGMKSYGRAPTFLMLTGYEQARSVVALLDGDLPAARAVELVLPETGVCSTDRSGGGCCGPAPGSAATRPVASRCCA
jgi:thioredoxin reductase